MTRYLVVPQWQGSPAARAMLLSDGAEAIAGDLPRASCTRIEIPVEAGEALETGIRRFSVLTRVHERVREELALSHEPALVVGGDCSVAVPAIAHAASRHERLAVVWFDAHGDLHEPASSPSGAFAGMALRAVFTDGPMGEATLDAGSIVLAGARELDDPEVAALAASPVRRLSVDDLSEPDDLAAAVASTGATAVYIHVDLDVLDPAVLTGVALPVPFGLALRQLTAAIAAVRAQLPLAGSSISGFAPSTPQAAVDDLGTILRVVGALA